MKLIELSSNDVRFKPLIFKKDVSLNIIVGEKVLKNDKKKTSNGIGKSLSLICIDFMLGKGSQSKEIKKLKEIMKKEDIVLSLTFEHENQIYRIQRSHNQILLNEEVYTKESEYIDFLNKLVKDYSFRNLFSRFFRTNKDSYNEAVKQVTLNENPYENNKINAYLLGLDLEYLEKKKELKSKSDRLKVLIKELNAIQKTINREKEIEYEEKLEKIEKDLESFEIAEDFNQLKSEADILTSEIQTLRNQKAFFNREIRNKKNVIDVN
ncbi:MAG TPA: hypothetical protein ENK75_05815, partial [Saprospiraceae bacterium]|nr:hypothetical protein [Saprospiraceae bacterium]